MNKLTEKQIQQKLAEGRNYKRLYRELKGRFDEVKADNVNLRAVVAEQQAVIETLRIQIAELQTMVFGKKKQPPTGTSAPVLPGLVAKVPRSKDSYRRPTPPAHAVTSEVAMPLPVLCACGGSFDQTQTTTHERFEEDIPLPELPPDYRAQLITKYVITRSVCSRCGKHTAGKDLGGAQVALGPNVRLLVCHLISVGGMSYAQAANLLLALYGLSVSKGELAAIVQTNHQAWLSAYTQLKADIRAAPIVHLDETPWAIQQNDRLGYAWVLADASTPRVCYELAQSRGAIAAKTLLGQDTDHPFVGVRISDDYSPYRNPELPGAQQLCWAHLYRTIRDLRYNANLPQDQLPNVQHWYETFAAIYQDLRQYLEEPYDTVVRATQATELWQHVQTLAHQPAPCAGEPDKFTRLKNQLLRAGQDRLFVCLAKNTPCDNNRAERDLRQLVLKRKRSFGSQTHKGATALATILSLCTTTWRTTPATSYFSTLASLAG